MKSNISAKAEKAQKQEKKPVNAARILKIAMPVAACLCIAVIGAVKLIPMTSQNDSGKTKALESSENQEGNMQIASPFEEVDSAKIFEDRLGITADAPKGAKNVMYNILTGNVAQVDFELDGHEYMLRASKSDEELSGLYGKDKGTKQYDGEYNTQLKTIEIDGKDTYSLTWQKGSVYYTLVNTDGSSVSDILSVMNEL